MSSTLTVSAMRNKKYTFLFPLLILSCVLRCSDSGVETYPALSCDASQCESVPGGGGVVSGSDQFWGDTVCTSTFDCPNITGYNKFCSVTPGGNLGCQYIVMK